MMNIRDKELDFLLSPLRENLKNDDLFLKRWKLAVSQELKRSRKERWNSKFWTISRIAAAFVIGIITGGSLFSGNISHNFQSEKYEISDSSATKEYIYVKASIEG